MEEWPLHLIRRRHATTAGSPAGEEYDGKSYDFGSKVTGDITLTAQWVRTAHQWTITFDLNGGHRVF